MPPRSDQDYWTIDSTPLGKKNKKNSNAVFIVRNWGRFYDPVCLNLFNLLNVQYIETGKTRRCFKKVGAIYVQLKPGVKLITLKELLNRYQIKSKYRKGLLVYLNNQLTTRPRKLLFDASQDFKIETFQPPKQDSAQRKPYINVSVKKIVNDVSQLHEAHCAGTAANRKQLF
jgi:hypothetical protein